MRFTLNYRGKLFANGKPKHKHAIRQNFHKQLQILWQQGPLNTLPKLLSNPNKETDSIIYPLDSFNFAPLVCQKIGLVAELEITLFRPEELGNIVTQSGDIDNRLKTLFDALQMPPANQIKNINPQADENPFFCLLEDDNLIKDVTVKTDRLLEPNIEASEVLLIIGVTIRPVLLTWQALILSA